MGKAISDYFYAFWWQIYLASLLAGFMPALVIGLRGRQNPTNARFASLLQVVLYVAGGSVLLAAGMVVAQHHTSPWVSVLFLIDHLLVFLVDGVILAAVVLSLKTVRQYFPGFSGLLQSLLAPATVGAASFCVGSLYLTAGLMKILVRVTQDFFQASGYGDTFFFFIATWECIWGMGIWVRSVRIVAVGALSVEMLGAIYTHYHNYFTKGFPGPFGNSVDALRMLTLMFFVAFATVRGRKQGSPTFIPHTVEPPA